MAKKVNKSSKTSKTKKNTRSSRTAATRKVTPKQIVTSETVEPVVTETVLEEDVAAEKAESPLLNWILLGAVMLFVLSSVAFLAARGNQDDKLVMPTNSANISVQGELDENTNLNVVDGSGKNLPTGSSQSSSRLQPNTTSGVQGSNTDLNRTFNQPTSGYQGGGYTGNEKIN